MPTIKTEYHRYRRSYLDTHPDEKETITNEHLHRLSQGKTIWNQWNDNFNTHIKENNIDDALIDLSSCTIEHIDFDGYLFSGTANFTKTQFSDAASFKRAQFSDAASFKRAQFSGTASFRETQFSGTANFNEIQFSGTANFNKTQFSDTASFNGAQFSGYALFGEVQFSDEVYFGETRFSGITNFSEAQFSGTAVFNEAQFSSTANFNEAQFSGTASFRETQFSGTAHFNEAEFSGTAFFDSAEARSKSNVMGLKESHFLFMIFTDEKDINEDDLNNQTPMRLILSSNRVSAVNYFYLIRGLVATYNNYYYLITTKEEDADTIRKKLKMTFNNMSANDEMYISAVHPGSIETIVTGLKDFIPAIINVGNEVYKSVKNHDIEKTKLEIVKEQLRHEMQLREQAERREQDKHSIEMVGKVLELQEKTHDERIQDAITKKVLQTLDISQISNELKEPQSLTVKEKLPEYIKDASQHLVNGVAKNVHNGIEIKFEEQDKSKKGNDNHS